MKDGILEFDIPVEVLSYMLSFVPLQEHLELRRVSTDWLCAWNDEMTKQMRPCGQHRIQAKALWESQNKEIDILLNNESKVLEKTDNDKAVITAYQNLKEIRNKQKTIFVLQAREKILNKINEAIICQRIQESEKNTDSKLDCTTCSLTRFTDRVIEDHKSFFQTIQRIDICHNYIYALPENIGYCVSLEMLNIFNNRLRTLPDNIGKCVRLHTLSADINELTTLPDSICDCFALKYLEVSKNKLISLPENMSQCVSLRWISASWNKLAFLPQSIGQCEKLEWVKVSYNQLTMLPDSIVQCKELRRLSISKNYITTLPVNLSETILFDSLAGGFISKGEALASQDSVELDASIKKLRLG